VRGQDHHLERDVRLGRFPLGSGLIGSVGPACLRSILKGPFSEGAFASGELGGQNFYRRARPETESEKKVRNVPTMQKVRCTHLEAFACIFSSDIPMTQVGRSLAFFSAALLLIGCAGSSNPVRVSTDEYSGKRTYETRQMRLDDIEMSSGLEKEDRFYVQVVGACMGSGCTPSQYSLQFIKGGPRAVTVVNRDVTLTVGSETLRWEDAMTQESNQTSTIRSGAFAKVDVSSKQLATIGAGRSVRGTVCGERFTLPHQARAPIRALLSRLEEQSGKSSSDAAEGAG